MILPDTRSLISGGPGASPWVPWILLDWPPQSESSRVTFFPSLEGPELASAAGYNLPGLRDEEPRTTPVHLASFVLHGRWSQEGVCFLLSVTWQSPGGRQTLDSRLTL